MKAAGWVASPIISDLFKKASSYLGFDASEKLSELEPKILLLERVMGAVEASPCRPRLEGLYIKLKSAFYDAEEILDDIEYYRLQKIQDDKLKSEVAGPSRRLKQLLIKGLEKVESKAEALEANLASKEGLSTLKLSWKWGGEASPEVQAEFCDWHALPDYMEHLTSLQTLHITYCFNIRSLPALPQSLERLDLTRCNEVSMGSCCMERLTSLQTLMISSCDSILSLPTLPQSIKDFKLHTDGEVLLSSCTTAGDPDWQKIKHIPMLKVKGKVKGKVKKRHVMIPLMILVGPLLMHGDAAKLKREENLDRMLEDHRKALYPDAMMV
ncbi:hypothetical protein QYE76_035765 [Lolium multiflorum]|uniref:R13L1/DRL21-like LRR repeat region domain-containing protein n=1 Tax=Lolium multiflorum TaxID=4521 RepID=A0AAD8VLG8_LOLMU|nr:hypothetical protein QYE76_035765 [Lolium multiflorum]